ncbi:MerR family transcriptional regulator [Kitasatospora sp. CB02891]|uniref:MerR family transcriptional regulator n=1 Tax=Kitasatospora sp. CB02891 TaxID=2020329 RepID=UPI000C279B1E|nr:MerR family transcriptional regulator [Kitasatospora sp. CB02891]PJN25477.1 transcriptional regulator [Kitasatospora sp. CB02891]
MRLADLSEHSGVSLATIKYYLREGLLPPGRRINATQAEYDESHLRRLRLVRAMIQVGRIPVATVREVLAHVDDDSLGLTFRLGAALWALPHPTEPSADPEDDPSTTAAHTLVADLLARLGWRTTCEVGDLNPAHRALVAALATLDRLGYPLDTDDLLPYARTMEQAAAYDLDRMEVLPTPREQAEYAVAGAVLFEPVLLNLRRLAQAEESGRRYGL